MVTILQFTLVVLAVGALIMCVLMVLRRRTGVRVRGSHSPMHSVAFSDPRTDVGAAGTSHARHIAPADLGGRATTEPRIESDGSTSKYRVRPGWNPEGPQWDPYA